MQTQLPKVDLQILKMLWVELHSGRGFGLTRKQIFEEFKRSIGEGGPLVRTDAALRVHLRLLVQRKPALVVVKKMETNEPGGRPHSYAIDRDSIITWPSTATMLVELWKAQPVRSVERATFVEQMLQRNILNSSTGKPATENEILKQLKTSQDWGYIAYVNESVMLPGDRLEFELEYLEFVASYL
jgi:hypothetical protein